MVNSLIEFTLNEIAGEYQAGALPWMKRDRPDKWNKMKSLEREIDKMALCGDLDGLRGALDSYQGLILKMVKEFKLREEKKGQRVLEFK